MGFAERSRAPGNLELAIYAIILLGKAEIGIALLTIGAVCVAFGRRG